MGIGLEHRRAGTKSKMGCLECIIDGQLLAIGGFRFLFKLLSYIARYGFPWEVSFSITNDPSFPGQRWRAVWEEEE